MDCTGYNKAALFWKATLTDLRSGATAVFTVFAKNRVTGEWHNVAGEAFSVGLTGTQAGLLRSKAAIEVGGVTGLAVLCDSITGQGASVDVWVELF